MASEPPSGRWEEPFARTASAVTSSPPARSSYLELDRGTEPARRVGDKLRRYPPALANDEKREFANVLLVCGGAGRLANLARQVPAGPPWFWGSVDLEHHRVLPRGEERSFEALPAIPRDPRRSIGLCLGKRWRQR